MKNPKDVRTLFDEALELPAAEREPFLRRECTGLPELLENVIGLVRAHLEATGGLATHAPIPESLIDSIQTAEILTETIGPYRLIRKIGEGGMGTVYLGLRSDDAFRKIVAIKVMRRDRATDEFSRRFKQERQVLANLEHPNISRILDGGATDDGLPYYVMDYVDGKPIDDYCNQAKLGLVDRVTLFQQVCAAVNYLHENLIVHRDLKPSNILVTSDGVAKLLDFGIAKVQTPGNSNQTIDFDGRQTRLMTPGYASPEQINGESVTRASDIYSLGVILYELLTGRPPFPNAASGIGIERSTDPPKPSTNIRADLQQTRETTSQLKRRLAGDLDNIVLMALRRSPNSRYGTAKEFAEDLQSYLEGKSVRARRDTVTGRTVKFVRRNPLRAAAVLSIVVLLMFGAWQTVQAYGQRIRADAKEAEIARLMAVLTQRMDQWPPAGVTGIGPGYLQPEDQVRDMRQMNHILNEDFSSLLLMRPGRTPQRDSLVQQAVSYLGQAEQRGRSNVALVREVAQGYQSVAALQSHPVDDRQHRGFGDGVGAISNYRNSGALLLILTQQEPNDVELQQQLQSVQSELNTLGAAGPPPAVPNPLPAPVSVTPTPEVVQQQPARSKTVSSSAGRNLPAIATEVPAAAPAAQASVPTPPAARPEPTPDLGEALQLYVNVESKIHGADERLLTYRRDMAARGLSARSDITTAAERMKANLQLAKQELDRKDPESAKSFLKSADAYATQVLTFFGR